VNIFVVDDFVDRDDNGASQFNKKASIANNGFFNIFGIDDGTGVEFTDETRVDENFSVFDFDTINCFAFLIKFSSSCK
jgi:hypothetical protein